MLRSLFTGISGLGAHQQMLDVTANNIANVNTIGYKSSATDVRGHPEPDPGRRRCGHGAHRRHQPDPDRPRRQARRYHHNFTEGSAQATGGPAT